MTAIPALAQAAAERKTVAVSSVLARIRTSHPRSSRMPDAVFALLIFLTAASVFAIVVFVLWELLDKSRLSLHQFGLGFFYGHDWDPVNDQYGALPFIYGTLVSSFLALFLASALGWSSCVCDGDVPRAACGPSSRFSSNCWRQSPA